MKEIKFRFDNAKAAEHFLTWLSEAGEQDYWTWMEYREEEEEGDITCLDFDYDKKNGVVNAECGRLSDE